MTPPPRRGKPADRGGKPAERRGAPAERRGKPADRGGKPAERRGAPAERRGAPAERRGKPADRGGKPAERRGAPAERRGAPAERRGAPAERRGAPAERRSAPADRRGKPTEQRGRGSAERRGGTPSSGARDERRGRPAPERGRRPAEPRDKALETPRADEPRLPDGLDVSALDRSVRAELRSLSKLNAEIVAGHLIMASEFLDSDPQRALAHARAARGRATRVAAVREAVGVAAYHAEEWAEALTELRTARRISGDPHTLPLIADTERALGRPQRALTLLTDPDVRRLDAETRAELYIVVAGARRDLGQLDAALAVLARGGLDRDRPKPGSTRLWYAYGDALEAAGRIDEAAAWFAASAGLDADGDTDAAERAAALL